MSNEKSVKGITVFSRVEYDNHQKSLSTKKEWPGINIRTDSRTTLNIPVLIMELYRLVPYKEGRYIDFHPFNMPHIKVHKIELVGIVMHVKHNVNNLFLTIEDGTGVVQVNYKLEQYMYSLEKRQEIDKKYRNQAENVRTSEAKASRSCSNKFPETRPKFSYPRDASLHDIAVLENEWWSETNGGLLGKEIQPFDYVYVTGYPCLDSNFQKIPEQITAEFIENARLTVFAMSVTCTSEEMYNKKLLMWINTTICQRYTGNKGCAYTRKNK
ncbi:PREDICTED: uncharacterized protein LOC108761382 [Trachymyrmex cornetzi]|uniref:Uncharacterized protein n=1 Tax=Trachymyrmex cornetzi TaxID=471704 RepID=A0A195E2Y2_9HYME|nr:PREDICTED: uncharacterized protein LOC108761382 [Trachymyrmex cornetzi]KYN19525.1 hypothetical protein ALC57_08001 [Trachymyrmex cornetzi]